MAKKEKEWIPACAGMTKKKKKKKQKSMGKMPRRHMGETPMLRKNTAEGGCATCHWL